MPAKTDCCNRVVLYSETDQYASHAFDMIVCNACSELYFDLGGAA